MKTADLVIFYLLLFLAVVVGPLFVTDWNYHALIPKAGDVVQAKISLWLIFIALQGVFWVIAVFYLRAAWKRLTKVYIAGRAAVRQSAVGFIVPGAMLILLIGTTIRHFGGVPPETVGGYNISNLRFLGATGILLSGFAIAQMFIVRDLLILESRAKEEISEKIALFLGLRNELNRLLAIAAVVLALGTLAGAALRNAVNAERANFVPAEYITGYGLLYSILLLGVYLPLQGTFVSVGRDLMQSLTGEPPASSERLQSWREQRQRIEQIFGLDLSKASILGQALSVLLPWIASLFKNLIGGN